MRTVEQRTEVAATAIGGRFKGYGPESERAVGEADVRENEMLDRLKKAFGRTEYSLPITLDEMTRIFLSAVKDIQCSADDIEKFSVVLKEFQEVEKLSVIPTRAGRFLSALINKSGDSDFTVHTTHLDVPVEFLGYENKKNITVVGGGGIGAGDSMIDGRITVEGDVMHQAAMFMSGGSMLVRGDAGRELGREMKGGHIIVEGNVEDSIGRWMRSGRIDVKGNAGECVGEGMHGGEIHVHGEIGSIGHLFHGRIYHKGELIVNK
jgi:hypothetical protein